MQQFKYASTAWNDIKNSPGWLGRIALLALLQVIPIFGQIVLLGYVFGWARDIAWGVHAPMPAKIFGNEDGKLYSRGFFVLVILFVFNLVPYVLGLFSTGFVAGLSATRDGGAGFVAATFGMLIGLISMVLSLAVLVFFGIAAMRTSIYDRISAGFQIKKLWAMFKHDPNGVLRILGMFVLIGIIGGMAVSMVVVILSTIVFGASLPVLMGLNSGSTPSEVYIALGPSLGIWTLLMLVVGFAAAMLTVFSYLMCARAYGYWTRQFQVAQWRGQDDPMPFESAEAQRQAQAAQYAAQVQYAQAQAEYAQAQGQQINYANQQAQQQYAQAAQAQNQAAQAAQAQAQASQAQQPIQPDRADQAQGFTESFQPQQPDPSLPSQPDNVQRDNVQPDNAQLDHAQPNNTQPDNAQPGNAQPGNAQPESPANVDTSAQPEITAQEPHRPQE